MTRSFLKKKKGRCGRTDSCAEAQSLMDLVQPGVLRRLVWQCVRTAVGEAEGKEGAWLFTAFWSLFKVFDHRESKYFFFLSQGVV